MSGLIMSARAKRQEQGALTSMQFNSTDNHHLHPTDLLQQFCAGVVSVKVLREVVAVHFELRKLLAELKSEGHNLLKEKGPSYI